MGKPGHVMEDPGISLQRGDTPAKMGRTLPMSEPGTIPAWSGLEEAADSSHPDLLPPTSSPGQSSRMPQPVLNEEGL